MEIQIKLDVRLPVLKVSFEAMKELLKFSSLTAISQYVGLTPLQIVL